MPIDAAPLSQTSTAPRKAMILTIILASYMMIVLDISIVITALPKLHDELGFTDTGLSWVQSAYTLAFGGFLLLGARAGDILGRRRMFLVGLAIFTVASVVIAVAPSAAVMLAARAVQGFGSAVLAPSTLALIQTNFAAGPERTRAVALYGAIAGIASSVGLVAGGVLADLVSWRAGFLINLPIGLAMILATPRFIAETERHAGRFDLAGAITSTVGMTALVYAVVRSASSGWTDAATLATLAAGLVLLAVFVRVERTAAQPILPLALFAHPVRAAAYAARVFFLGGMIGFWFFISLFLQDVAHWSPLATGLAFLPTTLVNFASAMAVPKLTRRFGNGRLLATGLLIGVVGLGWLSRIDAGTSYAVGIALPMILIGFGQGLVLGPLTAAGIADVDARNAGAASGLVNVSHQIGSALGLSVLVAVAGIGSTGLRGTALLAHRISTALTAGTLLLTVATVLAMAFIARRPGARR
ncbi:MFS transporter [Siculibacillus lacustris]|uniref:MFS transporter n=1 Tax=Siculibacillus lacustris TaxID=1549641 RepID=A0A4Q9VER9_9HYPH|nr:MFS transporter [Siculibacillus lacustris]TBW33291.1 MFS transporter [Siculibacillus lacustris]